MNMCLFLLVFVFFNRTCVSFTSRTTNVLRAPDKIFMKYIDPSQFGKRMQVQRSQKGRGGKIVSCFIGVSWIERSYGGRWLALLPRDITQKRRHIGLYTKEKDAGTAYDAAMQRYAPPGSARRNFHANGSISVLPGQREAAGNDFWKKGSDVIGPTHGRIKLKTTTFNGRSGTFHTFSIGVRTKSGSGSGYRFDSGVHYFDTRAEAEIARDNWYMDRLIKPLAWYDRKRMQPRWDAIAAHQDIIYIQEGNPLCALPPMTTEDSPDAAEPEVFVCCTLLFVLLRMNQQNVIIHSSFANH